jgi:hypothetical protein
LWIQLLLCLRRALILCLLLPTLVLCAPAGDPAHAAERVHGLDRVWTEPDHNQRTGNSRLNSILISPFLNSAKCLLALISGNRNCNQHWKSLISSFDFLIKLFFSVTKVQWKSLESGSDRQEQHSYFWVLFVVRSWSSSTAGRMLNFYCLSFWKDTEIFISY